MFISILYPIFPYFPWPRVNFLFSHRFQSINSHKGHPHLPLCLISSTMSRQLIAKEILIVGDSNVQRNLLSAGRLLRFRLQLQGKLAKVRTLHKFLRFGPIIQMRTYLAGKVIEFLCFFFSDFPLQPRWLWLLAADDRLLKVLREWGRRAEASRTDKVDDGVKLFEVVLKRSAWKQSFKDSPKGPWYEVRCRSEGVMP